MVSVCAAAPEPTSNTKCFHWAVVANGDGLFALLSPPPVEQTGSGGELPLNKPQEESGREAAAGLANAKEASKDGLL